jgi:hypothetical protein
MGTDPSRDNNGVPMMTQGGVCPHFPHPSVALWFQEPQAASTFPFVSGNRKAAIAIVA